MLININGDTLAVNFHHGVEGDTKPSGHKNRNAGRRFTECTIKIKRTINKWKDSKDKLNTSEVTFFDTIAKGKAICSFEDVFVKRIGRSVAFSRAVKNMLSRYTKEECELITEDYCKKEGISQIVNETQNPDEKIVIECNISPIMVDKIVTNKGDVGLIAVKGDVSINTK